MFRGGGFRFLGTLFRLTGAGVKTGSEAIPGGPIADIATVGAFVFAFFMLGFFAAAIKAPGWFAFIVFGGAFGFGWAFNAYARWAMANLDKNRRRRRLRNYR